MIKIKQISLLAFVFMSQQTLAMNTFTLYAFKSSVGVNWKSPKALATSVVKNDLLSYVNGNDRLLGHVAIELRCGTRQLMTAMSSRPGETTKMVLKENAGLGVLFHIFPGMLESAELLKSEIALKRRSGRVNSATYIISDAACDAMFEHYDHYVRSGGPNNYGFPLDTLAGEGAGCSAFGVSFLQAAHIADEKQLKAWSGSVWVPQKYIGPHNETHYTDANQATYPNNEGGDDVKLIPLLLKPGKTHWALAHEAGARYLQFFDPDTMHQWMKKMAKDWSPSSHYQKRTFNKSVDLVFDYRNL